MTARVALQAAVGQTLDELFRGGDGPPGEDVGDGRPDGRSRGHVRTKITPPGARKLRDAGEAESFAVK